MAKLLPSVGLLLISMISIQYGASVAKGLFPLAGATGTTALRVLFSALVLSLVTQLWKVRVSSALLKNIAFYGISLGSMNLLFYLSLERIPLGIAVALEFTGPLFVALYSSKKWTDYIWLVLAALGIFLLMPSSVSVEALDLVGVFLALAAGVFWGLYIVFGKRASGKADSLHITALGMWAACLVVVPVGLWFRKDAVLDFDLWPLGLWIALLSSAIPYALEMKALKNIPANTFGILMSLEPVVAMTVGFIFLKETLLPIQIVAVVLIIVASAGSSASSSGSVEAKS